MEGVSIPTNVGNLMQFSITAKIKIMWPLFKLMHCYLLIVLRVKLSALKCHQEYEDSLV